MKDVLQRVRAKTRLGKLNKGLILGAVLLFVFWAGTNVGSGKWSQSSRHSANSSLPAELDYDEVNRVYRILKDSYNGKLTAQQLEDGMKQGLAEATDDPYTQYFTAKEAQQFESQLNNTFSGIGAELGQDKDKNLLVISPISDFPAQKAGLKAQDIIVTIDGKTTAGMSVEEAVSKIRGKSGTVVKLDVVRNRSQALQFSITRENIQVPSVTSKMLSNNIGYIRISRFSNDTYKIASKDAIDLKQQGATAIILDLRGNPGGLLDEAVNVSSLWVPKDKLIVSERGTIGTREHRAIGDDLLKGMPTVVLIDAGSASSSEIVAGALLDNKVATLIGVKSYGKGVVQQLICVTGTQRKDGSCPQDELKVTIASWYRPNGQNINGKGVSPSREVKAGEDDKIDGPDAQLDAATQFLTSTR